MTEHYIVRWRGKPEGKWNISWPNNMTREEAEEMLAKDIAYFYDDIEIQLVKVMEEVVSSHSGSHRRRYLSRQVL